MGSMIRDYTLMLIVVLIGLGAIYYGIVFRAPEVERHHVFIRSCILAHPSVPAIREYCDALWDLQEER